MRPIRCAIYTRKSTEEGLDQNFNSLHAQRGACEAWVTDTKDTPFESNSSTILAKSASERVKRSTL